MTLSTDTTSPPCLAADLDDTDDDLGYDPTRPVVARFTVDVEQPDGSFERVDDGPTDFVGLTDARSLGKQAQRSARLYRDALAIPGRVRVGLQIPGGSGASNIAGPDLGGAPVTVRDLGPAERDLLRRAYADGHLTLPDGHTAAENLVAAGLLARGPQILDVPRPRRRYQLDGPVVASYAVEARLDGVWTQVEADTRRLPDADPETLDNVADAIAAARQGPEPIRVSVAAGPEVAWVEQAPTLTGRRRVA